MMSRKTGWRLTAGVLCVAGLIAAPTRSGAAISEYTTRTGFVAAVLQSATDTFEDLDSQLVPTPLARSIGPYSYSINAATGVASDLIYGLPSAPSSPAATWLTTNAADSVLTLSGFSPGVNGIGASFFLTTFFGDIWMYSNASLTVTATFASGSVSEAVSQASDTSFLGFVSDNQLLSLTVATVHAAGVGPYWLTVGNLALASPSPVPEGSTGALMLAGLTVLFTMVTRYSARRDTAA
jgi:hypothetical protein